MYKLLLVTDQEDKIALLQHQIDWPSLGCRAPQIVRSAEAGVELLNSSAVDAVGYSLKGDSTPLTRYLRYGRPSLPIFEVAEDFEKQRAILKETVQLLDRLHADFSDDYYDEDAMLTLQRDELVTQLLSGQLRDYAALERELRLIRSRVDAHGVCALYELDMPQGEVYLSEHHGHAQQRLESALRNNFVGRYVDDIYYAVSVQTPRHIRLLCLPLQMEEPEPSEAFLARAEAHVQDSIQRIKEYLDLDMQIVSAYRLDGLKALLEQ